MTINGKVEKYDHLKKAGRIYCQGCHARRYGGAGYRGAGAAWVEGGVQSPATPTRPALALLKPRGAGAGCGRCGGSVFEAEKVCVSADLVFHRSCLSCCSCGAGLELATAWVEDGAVYCRTCCRCVQYRCTVQVYCRTCCRSLATRETHNTNTATDSIKAEGDKAGCPACGGKVMEGSCMMAI